MVVQERLEAPFGYGREDQVGARRHAGTASLMVEQSHLAEVVSGTELAVAAVGGRHFGLAFQDDEEPDAALASDHDLGALRVLDLAHLLGHPLEVARGEALEDANRLEVHRRDSTSRRETSTACAGAYGQVPRGRPAGACSRSRIRPRSAIPGCGRRARSARPSRPRYAFAARRPS